MTTAVQVVDSSCSWPWALVSFTEPHPRLSVMVLRQDDGVAESLVYFTDVEHGVGVSGYTPEAVAELSGMPLATARLLYDALGGPDAGNDSATTNSSTSGLPTVVDPRSVIVRADELPAPGGVSWFAEAFDPSDDDGNASDTDCVGRTFDERTLELDADFDLYPSASNLYYRSDGELFVSVSVITGLVNAVGVARDLADGIDSCLGAQSSVRDLSEAGEVAIAYAFTGDGLSSGVAVAGADSVRIFVYSFGAEDLAIHHSALADALAAMLSRSSG